MISENPSANTTDATSEQLHAMLNGASQQLRRDDAPPQSTATEGRVLHADFLPFGRLARRWTPLRHSMARGTSLIEMTVVLVVLLIISFGMAEFSYAFFVKNTLEAAAREGARAGIVSSAVTTDVEPAVAAQLRAAGLQTSATVVDTAKFTLTLSPTNPATMAVGATFQVPVALRRWDGLPAGVRPMSTMLGSGALGYVNPLPGSKSISASATMRKEG